MFDSLSFQFRWINLTYPKEKNNFPTFIITNYIHPFISHSQLTTMTYNQKELVAFGDEEDILIPQDMIIIGELKSEKVFFRVTILTSLYYKL